MRVWYHFAYRWPCSVGNEPTHFEGGRCKRCPPTSENSLARRSIRSGSSTRPRGGRLASVESRIFPPAARVLPTGCLTKYRLNSSYRFREMEGFGVVAKSGGARKRKSAFVSLADRSRFDSLSFPVRFAVRLVPRTRTSHHIAARVFANFGFKRCGRGLSDGRAVTFPLTNPANSAP